MVSLLIQWPRLENIRPIVDSTVQIHTLINAYRLYYKDLKKNLLYGGKHCFLSNTTAAAVVIIY